MIIFLSVALCLAQIGMAFLSYKVACLKTELEKGVDTND